MIKITIDKKYLDSPIKSKPFRDFKLIGILHCDDENCDLGQLQFDCPFCNKVNITCEGWYELEEYKTVNLKCEYCNKEFITTYNPQEYKWEIEE